MGMFDDITSIIIDALAPNYKLFGQSISYGSAWASSVFPDDARIPYGMTGISCDPSTRRGCYFFVPCGNPFSVLNYVLERNDGTIPDATKLYYYDSSGAEVTSADPYDYYLGVIISGGKAWFCMEFSNSDYNAINGYFKSAQQEAGYTGCSLDVTHITQEDYKFSEFHLFRWVGSAYRPDLTNLNPNSGGQPQYDFTNSMCGFMNGTMKAKYFSNSRVCFQDMIFSDPVTASTSYDSGVTFFSPDFRNPPSVQVEGYYYLSFSTLPLLGYWVSASIFGGNSELIDNFEIDTAQTGEGGTGGNYNPYSDSIGFSGLPNLGFSDTGFARLYTGTTTQIQAIAQYMWNDSGFDSTFKRWLFGDNGGALNAIINFGILPIDLSAYRGTSENVTIGNVPTNIPLFPLTQEYISIDMGYIDLRERWSTALDYTATQVDLYLPFIGFIQIPVSDIMRPKSMNQPYTIRLRYNVNLFTGDCMAELVGFTRETPHANVLLASHAGNMMIKCPTSAGDYSAFFKNIIGGAAQIIGNPMNALAGPAGDASGLVTGAIQSVCSVQPVQRSGNIAGASSVLGTLTPYLVVHQPEQWLSEDYGALEGFPSMMDAKLGNLSGYTEVDAVELDSVPALKEEINEIENLLNGGVFL